MLYVKAWHIIAMVTWFAGLFYLPRLFVYHAETSDALSIARFKTMERRLYYGITWPGGVLTTVLGALLLSYQALEYLQAGWMQAKIFAVLVLWGYHLACGYYVRRFAADQAHEKAIFFRIFNEIPTILLITIVLLVVIKPFHTLT